MLNSTAELGAADTEARVRAMHAPAATVARVFAALVLLGVPLAHLGTARVRALLPAVPHRRVHSRASTLDVDSMHMDLEAHAAVDDAASTATLLLDDTDDAFADPGARRGSGTCGALALLVLVQIYVALSEWGYLQSADKNYNRDVFFFLLGAVLVAALASARKSPLFRESIMSRPMTDEWKGASMIVFLLYHYFDAKQDVYAIVRVLVAGFVFLTGFGNYKYFTTFKDYSLRRILRMMFRLNALVVILMITTGNSIVLYYICPMHTYWFLSVYLVLGIKSSWNDTARIWYKFAAYAVCNALVFEGGLGKSVLFPLLGPQSPLPILSYMGNLDEWVFRTNLDHWACLWGMLFAHVHPHLEARLRQLKPAGRARTLLSVAICMTMVALTCIWASLCLVPLEKRAYNRTHPYFSVIPIFTCVLLRNITPRVREHTLSIFSWLGKISLETYLLQFHVWLNRNTKGLAVLPLLGEYPLCNFLVTTVVFLALAKRCSDATNTLSDAVFGARAAECPATAHVGLLDRVRAGFSIVAAIKCAVAAVCLWMVSWLSVLIYHSIA